MDLNQAEGFPRWVLRSFQTRATTQNQVSGEKERVTP
jgi:hypothetical protein